MHKITSRAIIGMILNALDQPSNTWVDEISMFFNSTQELEEYAWLGTSPVMREWVGERIAKGLAEEGFKIRNKTFEATLPVSVDDLRRDKTGQLMARIAQLAERAKDHDAKLLTTLIMAAENALCYDGQFFFDTDHVSGDSGVQDNDLTLNVGTPSAPTSADMESAILQATEKMLGYKDDQGEPINGSASKFLVMAPVNHLRAVAGALGTTVILEGGQSRTNMIQAVGSLGGFTYGMSINPRLTNADRLYLFRADGATKPFIRQLEEDTTVSAIAEGSEEEFKNNRHLYGVKRIGNVGYGLWTGSVLTTLT
ncbi:Mu-like prophage major head subunit gpT family protein [Mesoterricola silvestris]|uniref:Bacteriophage Mu GpT domain-containing protein n=1 Tax=Mesoterricola silvestris TaxID=2927979 RepID=A0AA48GYX1_9BACT|nr:Mu-like prophage major head subunit gpT family protein [Mesoterricola silvestris]BDU72913.1 hypothetical protein METEAL_20870 [Mesoterricola silvestris]